MGLPNKIYKFLPKKYVRDFKKNGTLRIGTLYDFRKDEHGSEIGDSEEGKMTLKTGDGPAVYDSRYPSPDTEWQQPYINNRFNNETGQHIKIVAFGGIHHSLTTNDYYVFCAGKRFDWTTVDEESYNACIQIDDPYSFGNELHRAIPGNEPGYQYGEILYSDKTMLGRDYPGYNPALVKPLRYQHQKEFRYLFYPGDSFMPIEPVMVEVKKARRYCKFIGL